jgi:hypothetical protein
MPLGRGIVEVFEAIPDRIEVSGQEPTWRVTGGSFEAVVAYASQAFDHPTVVGREDRGRWWPRVTLTVTTDPTLAEQAPPPETFADPVVPEQPAGPVETEHRAVEESPAPQQHPRLDSDAVRPESEAVAAEGRDEAADDDGLITTLEEIFAHQEELRQARHRIPGQHSGD